MNWPEVASLFVKDMWAWANKAPGYFFLLVVLGGGAIANGVRGIWNHFTGEDEDEPEPTTEAQRPRSPPRPSSPPTQRSDPRAEAKKPRPSFWSRINGD